MGDNESARIRELESLLEYERGLNASLRDVMKDEERASRQAFIRQAAIGIHAGGMAHYEEAWEVARNLWKAKPEDC